MSTKESQEKRKLPSRLIFREYIESLSVAIILALIFRFFVISAYKIPTGSMVPTLKVGDFILASKLSYGFHVPFSGGARIGDSLPSRGDVIVFRFPADESIHYVKRVVALPGDRVEIRDKQLFINDKGAQYTDLDLKDYFPAEEMKGNFKVRKETIMDSNREILVSEDGETEFFGPVIVPPEHVFVLGDNRDSSEDSRYWGMVPSRNLEGRVILIWLSFDWVHRWAGDKLPQVRWERIFQSVD